MSVIEQVSTREHSVKWGEMLNKVPQITLYFWVIKILCTTVGETFADFLNTSLNLGDTITGLIMAGLLAIALYFQFRAKKYTPGIYWFSIVLISVVGTLITDNLTDNLGVPLYVSTIVFSILLIITFVLWYKKEKTLSIHSIFTRTREFFYWLAILFTFALGTAAGDLVGEQLNLGYGLSIVLFAFLIGSIYLAYKYSKLGAVLAFWLAYILTRPLGASIGDYLSQTRVNGGLGLGTTTTSLIFLAAIFGTVIYLSVTKKDVVDAHKSLHV